MIMLLSITLSSSERDSKDRESVVNSQRAIKKKLRREGMESWSHGGELRRNGQKQQVTLSRSFHTDGEIEAEEFLALF